MLRREVGSKRGSLPPKEKDLTCMKLCKIWRLTNLPMYPL